MFETLTLILSFGSQIPFDFANSDGHGFDIGHNHDSLYPYQFLEWSSSGTSSVNSRSQTSSAPDSIDRDGNNTRSSESNTNANQFMIDQFVLNHFPVIPSSLSNESFPSDENVYPTWDIRLVNDAPFDNIGEPSVILPDPEELYSHFGSTNCGESSLMMQSFANSNDDAHDIGSCVPKDRDNPRVNSFANRGDDSKVRAALCIEV